MFVYCCFVSNKNQRGELDFDSARTKLRLQSKNFLIYLCEEDKARLGQRMRILMTRAEQ